MARAVKQAGILFVVLAGLLVPATADIPPTALRADHPPNPIPSVASAISQLTLGFEQNQGQTDSRVRFLARGRGHALFLTPDEWVLVVHEPAGEEAAREGPPPQRGRAEPHVVRMRLLGSHPKPTLVGLDEQRGRSHYLIGHDPRGWRRGIPRYARVKYEGVYRGVDLVFHGREGKLEYDLVLAPGTPVGTIRIGFQGTGKLRLDESGNLILPVGRGEVVQHAPLVYQDQGGVRRVVPARYVLRDRREVGFEVQAAYDKTQPLVIDPVLSYSTYLGGSSSDVANSIAVDGTGHAYVAGWTGSADFPLANPAQAGPGSSQDVFVAKLDPSGAALVYATYLGGTGPEWANGISVDGEGNAYLTGETRSSDFPTLNAVQPAHAGPVPPEGQDAFVAKLDPTGSRFVYSTYLGGSGGDTGMEIAIDAAGNAYVTGTTLSTDFPTANAFQPARRGVYDAFVAKLDSTGATLVYSTYLGGSGGTTASDVAVDGLGRAYVTGSTSSSDFPLVNPAQPAYGGGSNDAFVARLDPTGGTLTSSTYLGGADSDAGTGVAVDAAGNAWLTGITISRNFPTANPRQASFSGSQDAFVAKLDPTGGRLAYSTYLGGMDVDSSVAVAVDCAGSVHVAGWTQSTDFPTANPVQPALGNGPLYKTTDGGVGWAGSYSGLANSAILALAIDPFASSTLYAAAGAWHVFKSTDGGTHWVAARGLRGVVRELAIDPVTPSVLYAGTQYEGVFKSVDSGLTWSPARAGLPTSMMDGYVIVTALAVDPVDPLSLYAGTGGSGVYKSTDGGETWTAVNTGLTNRGVSALAVDPLTPATLYAGTVSGVFKSTDRGGHWGAVNVGLTSLNVRAVAIDPSSPTTLYAGAAPHPTSGNGGVFKSTDGGATWASASGGLTHPTAWALAIDPLTPRTLYAGTLGGGVFKSTDGGESWTSMSSGGLTGTNVFTLAIDPAVPSTVYAGLPRPPGASDAFVAGLDPSGSALLYSTYLGGRDSEGGSDIAVDSAGDAYVTGTTASPDFPTAGALQSGIAGGQDVFVMKISRSSEPPPADTQSPFTGTPFAVAGSFEAEDFDRGGEGVAYHDQVGGNAGSLYRPAEDVDIISPYADGHVVNNFETGEWLEYTISVPEAGVYCLEALVSSEFEGSLWHMEIDGVDVTGPVTAPNTGSWRTFQWVRKSGVSLAAGEHVLRIQADQEYFNLDALRISP